MATKAGSPWIVTPASCRAETTRGTKTSATALWTSSDSAALQTLVRSVLALSTMSRAMSRSASASTYTWQLPTPVSMTGTVDCSTTAWISPAPPRGMTRSTSPRACMRCWADDRSSAAICWMASAGSPAPAIASRMTAMIAALEWAADDEPRSSTALPDLRQIPAASAVTLGRPS